MKANPLRAWYAIQEDMLKLHARQFSRARIVMAGVEDTAQFQAATDDVVRTSARIWRHWVDLWAGRP